MGGGHCSPCPIHLDLIFRTVLGLCQGTPVVPGIFTMRWSRFTTCVLSVVCNATLYSLYCKERWLCGELVIPFTLSSCPIVNAYARLYYSLWPCLDKREGTLTTRYFYTAIELPDASASHLILTNTSVGKHPHQPFLAFDLFRKNRIQ